MVRVPAGEFQRHIGRYQDIALTQPVAVTRNRRERTVLISAEEYARLKRRDRQVLTLADFTEADIAALEATRAPTLSRHSTTNPPRWRAPRQSQSGPGNEIVPYHRG